MSFFGKKKKISQYKEADADGMWTWNVEYKKNKKGIDVDFEVIGTKPYIPKQPDPRDPLKMIEGSCDRLEKGLEEKRNGKLTDFDKKRLLACKVNRDNHFVREQAKKKKEEEDKRIKAHQKCLENMKKRRTLKRGDAERRCRKQAIAKQHVKDASIIAKATSNKIGKFGRSLVKKATKSNEKSRYKNFGGKRKTRKRRKSRKKHTKKHGKRRGNKSQRRRRKRKTRKH